MNDLGQGRMKREWRTIEAMMVLHCRHRHGGRRGALCPPCEELHAYAERRLVLCPFGADKPTCVNCKVHCYQPAMRERVRAMMRFAGPRMLLAHPWLALLHQLVDGRRPAPDRPARREGERPPTSRHPGLRLGQRG